MQQVKGVQPLQSGINPATWMLEVSTLNKEHELGVDFADIYRRSDLYKCAPLLCPSSTELYRVPLSIYLLALLIMSRRQGCLKAPPTPFSSSTGMKIGRRHSLCPGRLPWSNAILLLPCHGMGRAAGLAGVQRCPGACAGRTRP